MIIELEQFLGTYNPLVNPDGTYVNGINGLDWMFIFRGIILIFVLTTFFKLIVTLLKEVI